MLIAFPLRNGFKSSAVCVGGRGCLFEMSGSSAVHYFCHLAIFAILFLHRDTHRQPDTYTHFQWPFPSTTLIASSTVPRADKLYQATHTCNVHNYTHAHRPSLMSCTALLTRQASASMCVYVRENINDFRGCVMATIHFRSHYSQTHDQNINT